MDLFKNQIKSLVVQTNLKDNYSSCSRSTLFANILKIVSNLNILNYDPFDCRNQSISFDRIHQSVCSSSLVELRVTLRELTDCLYIVDGRFSQLRSLDAKIESSSSGKLFLSQVDSIFHFFILIKINFCIFLRRKY